MTTQICAVVPTRMFNQVNTHYPQSGVSNMYATGRSYDENILIKTVYGDQHGNAQKCAQWHLWLVFDEESVFFKEF